MNVSKKTYQTLCCIFELTMKRIFAPTFIAILIVFGKVPLLFAKPKVRLPTRSKIIDREIQKLSEATIAL